MFSDLIKIKTHFKLKSMKTTKLVNKHSMLFNISQTNVLNLKL